MVHSGWLQNSSRDSATRFSFSVLAPYSSWRLSCAKFIKSHTFAFVWFSRIRFVWLPKLLFCLVNWPFVYRPLPPPLKILNCANMKYLNHWKEIYVNWWCVNRFSVGRPVLERPSALPTPKCQSFHLASHAWLRWSLTCVIITDFWLHLTRILIWSHYVCVVVLILPPASNRRSLRKEVRWHKRQSVAVDRRSLLSRWWIWLCRGHLRFLPLS